MSLRSEAEDNLQVTSTGVVEKRCIFCKMSRRRINSAYQNLLQAGAMDQSVVQDLINQSYDEAMKREYGSADFIAKEIHYHKKCRIEFSNRVNKVSCEPFVAL